MLNLIETYALKAAEAFAAANREDNFDRAIELRREAYAYVDLIQAVREKVLRGTGDTGA